MVIERRENQILNAPYFWVRFFTIQVQDGKVIANPQSFKSSRIRMTMDLVEETQHVQETAGEQFVSSFWDNQNIQVMDHQNLMAELARRQNEFAKIAKPEDWKNRDDARKLEAIWDSTYLPSPNLKESEREYGVFFAEPKIEEMGRRLESDFLKALLERTRKILDKNKKTASFNEFVLGRIGTAYQFGIPVRHLLLLTGIGIDLNNNQYDLFNPSKNEEIERGCYQVIEISQKRVPVVGLLQQKSDREKEKWAQEFRELYGKEIVIEEKSEDEEILFPKF